MSSMQEPLNIGLCRLDRLKMACAIKHIRSMLENGTTGYVVTPNVDHLQRLLSKNGASSLREIYQNAELSLCDSRVLELIIKLNGKKIPEIIAGSTLTEKLFNDDLHANDRIFLVGGTNATANKIRALYGDLNIEHHNPSMGFIYKDAEVKKLIDLVCLNNPTHVFLAVGSPQQEILARKLCQDRRFKGVALCIGASLLFLVGEEKRAPQWLQSLRLEWLYRMLQSPVRLGKRYLSNALAIPAIYWNIKNSLSGRRV